MSFTIGRRFGRNVGWGDAHSVPGCVSLLLGGFFSCASWGTMLLPIQGGYERETEGTGAGDPSSPHLPLQADRGGFVKPDFPDLSITLTCICGHVCACVHTHTPRTIHTPLEPAH